MTLEEKKVELAKMIEFCELTKSHRALLDNAVQLAGGDKELWDFVNTKFEEYDKHVVEEN